MSIPEEPPEPGEPGGGGGTPGTPPPGSLPGLAQWLRPRYTCNVAVTEEIQLLDLLNDVIFPSARMFMSMGSNGKIRFGNKKPVDNGLGTSAIAVDDTDIDLDNVMPWVSDPSKYLLISPHTNKSEVRTIDDAFYPTSQNSITLTQTGSLFSITGFSGADGASTPATASIVIGTHTATTTYALQLDGIEIAFTTQAADTKATIGTFLYGALTAHPALNRRFFIEWDGVDTVSFTAIYGTITVNEGLDFAHDAPLTDPVTAPTLASATGTLAAGDYAVAYTFKNAQGQTLLSEYKVITLAADKKIQVSSITPPGSSTVVWYVVCEADSTKLRYHSENDGSAFDITSLPLLTAALPPDVNRTGVEVMRVQAVFSDRGEVRASIGASNVLRGTFQWILGNRAKSTNQISLKYRDSGDDWRLVELRLRDDAHIAKIGKISKKEINGQAIDNYFQAYRIASGLLAELREGDFFYKWSGTREALLLEEFDVVAITDGSSGVVNLPVSIEELEFDVSDGSLPKVSFTGRKFANVFYDDSPNDYIVPIISEIS